MSTVEVDPVSPDAPAVGEGLVGRPLRRREDERLLRGRGRYVDDLDLPGLAHAAFVRSPHPHARITGIRAPERAPGLLAVLTADDLGDRVRPLPINPVPGATLADAPHPILAGDEVRYAGQPVVCVVAESRALAEDAAELVEVDYEPLEAVADPRRSDRELMRFEKRGGDVDAAFAAADVVVRREYRIPRVAAVPMEPRGAVASYDDGADLLTVWISAQEAARPHAHLAHVLRRPDDRIRVIVPDVGGAFGSKGTLPPEVAAIAVAGMDLGRPVKWAEDRMENFLAAYQGRGVEAEVELALERGGRMLGMRARILADLGAYLHPTTGIPPHTMAMLMCGCYDLPAAEVELVGAATNKVPTAPYRGAGRPEAAYVLELTVDAAARELGMDPVELRRANVVEEFPHKTPLGWTYDSGAYRHCLDRAVELVRPERHDDGERLVGTGVALYVERAGGQWESAHVTIEPSGRVVVRTGVSPHGQGHDTTLAQIAADQLGIDIDDVALRFGDTAVVPRGIGTFASRSIAMGGSAIVRAIDELRGTCVRIAAHLLEVDAGELAWQDGGVVAPDGRRLALAEIAAAAYDPRRLPPDLPPGLDATARFASDMVFGSGAYAAVVELHRSTGVLRVLRIAAVDDAGTIINPLLSEGQVIGAIVQGLGATLVEESRYDEQAQPLSVTFADYSLLTAVEVPPIVGEFVSSPSPLNPLGAKGVGEAGTIGAPAAVGNALADALGGLHVDPPLTEERLWQALRDAAEPGG